MYHSPITKRSMRLDKFKSENPETSRAISTILAIGLIGPVIAVQAFV